MPNTPKKKTTATKPKSSTEKIFGSAVYSHGYTALPNILVRAQSRLGLNPVQFNILAQLLSYWIEPNRPPFPPKRDLVQRMGITEQTLQKHIRELETRGFLQREQQLTAAGDYGSNIYHLDGLVKKLRALAPDFDEERDEREKARAKTEKPMARANARRAAKKA